VAYKLTVEELRTFHDDLSSARQKYRRRSAKDITAESFRKFADALNDRWEDYENELESGDARVRRKNAREAIGSMNAGMGKLADELRVLASVLEIFDDPRRSRSDRELDDALDTHKRRMEEVKNLITELMAKVKAVETVLSRSSGGSGKRDYSRHYGEPYWLESRTAGTEYL
jgi:predicted  nucleic acid-binding Zn-ribbon protein